MSRMKTTNHVFQQDADTTRLLVSQVDSLGYTGNGLFSGADSC